MSESAWFAAGFVACLGLSAATLGVLVWAASSEELDDEYEGR